MSSLESLHFDTSFFMDFTAASAKPLLSGLYGDESSCTMSYVLQKAENSPLNCGPPSVRIALGQPNWRNQAVSTCTTSDVCVRRNSARKGNPEKRSTMTRKSRPCNLKRSVPTWDMGYVAGLLGAIAGSRACDGRRVWQASHASTILSMSLAIDCQKYSLLANSLVLALPAWLA